MQGHILLGALTNPLFFHQSPVTSQLHQLIPSTSRSSRWPRMGWLGTLGEEEHCSGLPHFYLQLCHCKALMGWPWKDTPYGCIFIIRRFLLKCFVTFDGLWPPRGTRASPAYWSHLSVYSHKPGQVWTISLTISFQIFSTWKAKCAVGARVAVVHCNTWSKCALHLPLFKLCQTQDSAKTTIFYLSLLSVKTGISNILP